MAVAVQRLVRLLPGGSGVKCAAKNADPANNNTDMKTIKYDAAQRLGKGDIKRPLIHAASSESGKTLCGFEMGTKWFVHSRAVLDGSDATCPTCRKNIQSNASAMAPPPQRLPSTKDVPGG